MVRGLLAVMASGLLPLPAIAATAVSYMGVTATIVATCLNTATPMAFGPYTGVVAATTATITVTCTNTTPYMVSLSAGGGTAATVTARAMTGPASAQLAYVLTSDAAFTVNWGETVGTDTVAGVGTGAAQPITVHGQVAAGQYIAPGAYTDTVTATSLTVTNHGKADTSVQVKMISFEPPGGVEQRISSETVIISPAIGTIAPGATKMVTLVLRHPEQAKPGTYRVLLVDGFAPT